MRQASAPPTPALEPHPSPYFTTAQAAAYLGTTKTCLNKWRISGDGPPFLKLGPRRICYLKTDLDAWAESCRRYSTSDPGSSLRPNVSRQGSRR